ncbi:MAG: hypothetical protein FWH38_03225 [Treponema sp.]|nr:hypothetical protein [Treponema sp.]
MKNLFAVFVFVLAGMPVFSQANTGQLAPGATENLNNILNKAVYVNPTKVEAMGRQWFKMETDVHMFSDEVSIGQVAAVLLDLDNQTEYFNGKKNKLISTVVQRNADEAIVDFVSVTPALGIQIKTPYRATVKTAVNTPAAVLIDIRQLASDSDSNKNIKNLYTTRFAQEFSSGGKTYTYIRFYIYDEVNASILPGARGILESSSDTANEEAMQMIIDAAKKK